MFSFAQVSIPRPEAWTTAFAARLEANSESDGGGGSADSSGGGCSNPATDGVYVYVWEPCSRRVYKVGGSHFLAVSRD